MARSYRSLRALLVGFVAVHLFSALRPLSGVPRAALGLGLGDFGAGPGGAIDPTVTRVGQVKVAKPGQCSARSWKQSWAMKQVFSIIIQLSILELVVSTLEPFDPSRDLSWIVYDWNGRRFVDWKASQWGLVDQASSYLI